LFSRIARHLQGTTNALYHERDRLLSRGDRIIDFVSANVQTQGIAYPETIFRKALDDAAHRTKIYRPDPLGQLVARETVQAYYKTEGLNIPASHIVLTPGTSLSYWYAFKLLANEGDEILSPRPSYPLFDPIALLAGVHLRYYGLRESAQWEIDLDDLESKITSKTRAVILISPHNPTGAVASEREMEGVAGIASRHHLPLISDEVFSPFLSRSEKLPRAAATAAPLVLTLNGISKMWALPGMKLGWMVISGDPAWTKKAIATIETISDTFLPVNEISQFALAYLFNEGSNFLATYRSEIRERAETARQLLSRSERLSFIPPEGGFYITVKINAPEVDEEIFALELLRRHGVLVHPGYFYDLPPSHFVMSITSETTLLEEGIEKIIHTLENQDHPSH